MARLALLTPWPPQPSGIATCAADFVPALAAAGHAVDVLVDEALVSVTRGLEGPPLPGQVRVLGAHELVWRMARGHYDLPVYQIGNSWAHGFIWPYLFRYPGLTVMHDARLHHARATTLLSPWKRQADYRAEFHFNHPDVHPDAAELAIAGFDGAYYYQWPMRRAVVEASRLVAAHAPGVVRELAEEFPGRPVTHISLGHGQAQTPEQIAAARRHFRTAHGIPDQALVFGVLGHIAPERRIAPVVRAFASLRDIAPDARLLLAGGVDRLLPLDDLLREHAITDRVHVTGRLNDEDFDAAAAAIDVGLNLRWPSAEEMSGPWLRCLAAGTATVITDASHQANAPMLDPRTWRCHLPVPTLTHSPERQAIAVAIDILDEDHSLRLTLRRLATDTSLRTVLGANGRAWWQEHHTIERMAADYLRAIDRALEEPVQSRPLPSHARPDVLQHTRAVLWNGSMDQWIDGVMDG